jgi:TPR repeat protein
MEEAARSVREGLAGGGAGGSGASAQAGGSGGAGAPRVGSAPAAAAAAYTASSLSHLPTAAVRIWCAHKCHNVRCSGAGVPPPELLGCTGCLDAAYCSAACQAASWLLHRPMCRLWRAFYARHPAVPRPAPMATPALQALAASTGDAFAHYLLALSHQVGEPGQLAAMRAAAEGGCPPAQAYYALLLLHNLAGARGDSSDAIAWARRAAATGLVDGFRVLERCLHDGVGAPAHAGEERECLEAGAALGDPFLQGRLGQLREEAGDWRGAYALYSAGAEAVGLEGLLPRVRLALLLMIQHPGVPVDPARAFALHSECAALGDVLSQYSCGFMCGQGLGTRKDMRAAVQWLEQAAAQGHGNAQLCLGHLYRRGEGCEVNEARALQLYAAAAAQGNVAAVEAWRRFSNCGDECGGTAEGSR